ncbi:MAG: cation-translocating P-type ATPase [Chloroflexota bacterium]|nr:cation-translocating P-type ATPase [Chloroflexota bacterium]
MAEFHRLSVEQSLKELNVDSKTGLTSANAATREAQSGKNKLPVGEGNSLIKIVISQFMNILVVILIVAAVISALLGDLNDMFVILIIVVLNAALGTFQEYRAEQALSALNAMQVPQVRVRRDSDVKQISAEDLAPGDVVLLQEGDRVPADGRLIVSVNMQIEEAALTGESQAVFKEIAAIDKDNVGLGDRTNTAYMGTSVTYGRGEMVVIGTGLDTQLGKIAGMLMAVEETQTPLQKRLDNLSSLLVRGALVVVGIVFLVGLLRGIPVQEMLLTSISLAVAAVPESLPAIITISLSLGAARMVRRNVLIRKLPAVETLGSVTVICSDKTGTLTKNQMTATTLALPGHEDVAVSGIGYTPQGGFMENGKQLDPLQDQAVGRFLQAMALATDAYLQADTTGEISVVGDTTEGALLVAAQKVGWTRAQLERDLPRVSELPFSSDRKAMTTIHDTITSEVESLFGTTNFVAITKGAPDRLVEWASSEHMPDGVQPLSSERRTAWHKQIDNMASKGLRVLGVGYRRHDTLPAKVDESIERDLTLIGLIGILDPARPEAKAAVQTAKDAGIRPIMITGDHALTAEAIARDLGIADANMTAITGGEIEKMDDAGLAAALAKTSVFARVAPEHKMKLVKVLQSQNHIVAMTGDGVNDAPALKQANIGVAMGITGTEVSKGASDMVLTDDNFASIVAAVEEGRTIYDNIRKFVMFLLSSNVGEILVMFVGILVGLPIPLLAIQILWVNLVTDGLPAIALGFDPSSPELMKRKPRPSDESIFSDGVGRKIIVRAFILAALTLIAFILGHTRYNLDPFSPTRGLENFSRAQLVELVGQQLSPDDWDELSVEARVERLSEATNETGGHEGSENEIIGAAERLPRTLGFTVLALGQIFHVAVIHAGDKVSIFRERFRTNRFMFLAVFGTFLLQLAVIYVPFLQFTFDTYPLPIVDLLIGLALASVIMWYVEVVKAVTNRA